MNSTHTLPFMEICTPTKNIHTPIHVYMYYAVMYDNNDSAAES